MRKAAAERICQMIVVSKPIALGNIVQHTAICVLGTTGS